MTTILALNSGSSSLKFGVYDVDKDADLVLAGEAEWRDDSGEFRAADRAGKSLIAEHISVGTQQDAMARIRALLDDTEIFVRAVGHRIVHGGAACRQHCLIDSAVMARLERATEFAPLHAPPALSLIRYASEHFPGTPQVACLDTAFHYGLPDAARIFPISRDLNRQGVERFGFHGLSCESILRQLSSIPQRLVIAHLGSGASITAVKNGKSIDTSMGLTPTGGIVMGTRCGDSDPGVLLYLMRRCGYGAAELENLLDRRSGLLGISGISSDMRALHNAAATDANAKLAIEIFCYSVRKQIAAMAGALGGIDELVFTGGIGEHDGMVRKSVCDALSFLNIRDILVLPSLEDEQIALHAARLSSVTESTV